MTNLSQNQIDLIAALKTVGVEIANHVQSRFEAGETFDQVHGSLRRAVATVDGWRIGRGV